MNSISAIQNVQIQISYAGASTAPSSFTVTPSSFTSFTYIAGNALVCNDVTAGVPTFVSVKSFQVKANVNNLPVSSVVQSYMTPLSNNFEISYDRLSRQLFLNDASSTNFRIASGDIASIAGPQVTINMYY